jgi:hypothetical protein
LQAKAQGEANETKKFFYYPQTKIKNKIKTIKEKNN